MKKCKRNKGRNRWITLFFFSLRKLSCVNRSNGRNLKESFHLNERWRAAETLWRAVSEAQTRAAASACVSELPLTPDEWSNTSFLLPAILRCSLIIQQTMLLERPYNQHLQNPPITTLYALKRMLLWFWVCCFPLGNKTCSVCNGWFTSYFKLALNGQKHNRWLACLATGGTARAFKLLNEHIFTITACLFMTV